MHKEQLYKGKKQRGEKKKTKQKKVCPILIELCWSHHTMRVVFLLCVKESSLLSHRYIRKERRKHHKIHLGINVWGPFVSRSLSHSFLYKSCKFSTPHKCSFKAFSDTFFKSYFRILWWHSK